MDPELKKCFEALERSNRWCMVGTFFALIASVVILCLSMPNPKTCFDCMEEGNLEPAKWKRTGQMFNAIFRGICADSSCSNPEFNYGESIQRWDKENQETKYTHAWGCKL